ncbi:hypothetical protein A6R68_03007 [Neotoma lepida]|uniref:Cytosolic Fe-S cluster assembly factor NUBP1 n=1 Tax=Neotoma lepida TaxID=56216 RepID=A0A1A6GQJ6_NEOLE|nr:hypothetical protein A6R68_03007 [Neotoma lepida]
MEEAPHGCPGVDSAQAGRGASCQGCPNQRLCASGAGAAPDPAVEEIKEKMKTVKHRILVLSGKGGVGKSTFSAHLAHGLAEDGDIQVALLDIDICGPSIPKIMGLEGEQDGESHCVKPSSLDTISDDVTRVYSDKNDYHVPTGSPEWLRLVSSGELAFLYVEDNLGVMSVGFLLSSPDDAVIWRGPKKNGLSLCSSGMIKQFLRDVDWGDVDYLIVDTPPGTSDEHLSVVQYLAAAHIDGAVILTTPQEVALQDVRKEISFCHKVKLPIIGVVENMSGFICPKCKKESQIFPPTTGGAEAMCQDLKIPLLGKVPLDPLIGKSCDKGQSFFVEAPDSPATAAYRSIMQRIQEFCNSRQSHNENLISP